MRSRLRQRRDVRAPQRRWLRALGRLVYWLTVVAVALIAVAAFMLWLESRDSSSLDDGTARPGVGRIAADADDARLDSANPDVVAVRRLLDARS